MDLEFLVNSNTTPSEDEKAFLLQRITSLDGFIQNVDAELALAERTVKELSSRQCILRNKRKSYATVVSLLRRLPADVWIEIMKFAVWSAGTAASPQSQDVPSPTGVDPLARHLSPPLDSATGDGASHWLEPKQISVFTRVCKGWKTLLHSSAVFWCSLELHIYSNDDGLDEFAPKLEAWFNRSGNLPWSLKLLSSKRQLHAPLFASFLQRNCGRWKELRLYMQDLDVLAPLFHLEPSINLASLPSVNRGKSKALNGQETHDWTQLETLALDGWFTDSAKVHPFSSLNLDPTVHSDPSAVFHPPSICTNGLMPSLTSLILDMPCQKVHTWRWVPWAQLTDLDLRTGDSYEDNVSILAKCSTALQTCTLVFTPSLRLPAGVTIGGPLQQVAHGVANLTILDEDSDGGDSDDENASSDDADSAESQTQVLLFPKLKELTLKKIGYLSPLLSRLTLPALQKLLIAMSPINEPEPYLASSLIDFLDRSGFLPTLDSEKIRRAHPGESNTESQTSPMIMTAVGPPLTYLMLALENTRRRRLAAPVITNGEYLRIFERTEKLRTLVLRDYSTNAQFLERVNQRGLLPKLKTISFVVDASDEQVSGRFDEFVRTRTRSS